MARRRDGRAATSEKRRVPLHDIHPGANPRKDFGDLKRLASAIRATGGNPINPIVVVEDGTYDGEPQYRLVDGERRWRAMQQIHQTDWETDVIVFQSYEEADEAIAMVATDDKKALTDREIATGFQQMLRLDVDETTMAEALHRETEDIRRARRVAKTATGQATLDQLIAASYFEDEQDRDKILAANPGELDYVVGNLRRSVEMRERMRAIADLAEDIGLAITPDRPAGTRYVRSVYEVDELRNELVEEGVADEEGNFDGDAISAYGLEEFHLRDDAINHYVLYCEEDDQEGVAEEDEAERLEREAREERMAKMRAARTAFVDGLLHEVAIFGGEQYRALKALAGKSRSAITWADDQLKAKLPETLKDKQVAEHVWKMVTQSPASDYELLHWVYSLRGEDFPVVRDAMEISESDGHMLLDADLWFIEQVDAQAADEEAEDDE